MGTPYNGNPAGVTASTSPSATIPADGDPDSGATFSAPFQRLLDYIANLFSGPRVADGSAAAPAYSFIAEGNTGVYRAGASDLRVAVGGADALKVVLSSITLPAATQHSILATGANAQIQLRGNRAAADGNADIVLNSTVTRTAGALAGVFNHDVQKLLIDYLGLLRLDPGAAAAALQPASMWTAITPNAGWTTTINQTIAYWKDAFGLVHLKGAATFSSGTNPVFTLPVGFRPAFQKLFAAGGLGATTSPVVVIVNADGTVFIDNTAGAFASGYLEGITFLAEA